MQTWRRIKLSPKKNIIPYDSSENKNDLLNTFREIEEIVNDVYEPVKTNEKIKLDSANSQLKILQDGTK